MEGQSQRIINDLQLSQKIYVMLHSGEEPCFELFRSSPEPFLEMTFDKIFIFAEAEVLEI